MNHVYDMVLFLSILYIAKKNKTESLKDNIKDERSEHVYP